MTGDWIGVRDVFLFGDLSSMGVHKGEKPSGIAWDNGPPG